MFNSPDKEKPFAFPVVLKFFAKDCGETYRRRQNRVFKAALQSLEKDGWQIEAKPNNFEYEIYLK